MFRLGRRNHCWGFVAAGVEEGCTETSALVASVTCADIHCYRHCQSRWPQEAPKIPMPPRILPRSKMVLGSASCMQPETYPLIIPTIALGADRLLMSMATSTKRYSEDQVEYRCVCCFMLIGLAARYTLSRRRISTKRHSLL